MVADVPTFEEFFIISEEDGADPLVINLGSSPVEDGFCKTQPKIRNFALSSPTNLFIVFCFVIFSMGKNWAAVKRYFMTFLETVMDEMVVKGHDWPYIVRKYKDLEDTPSDKKEMFALNGYMYNHIITFWKRKEHHWKFILDNQDDEFLVFAYILENVGGLGPPKAGFLIQLVLGKLGCYDSINMEIFKKHLTRSKVLTKSGNLKSPPGKSGNYQNKLIEYAKAYHESMIGVLGDQATQRLWDLWCEIVEYKIEHAEFGKRGVPMIPRIKELELGQTKSYGLDGSPMKRAIWNAKKDGRYAKKDGITVSSEHGDIIGAGVRRFGEGKEIPTFEEFFYLPEMARRRAGDSESLSPRRRPFEVLYPYKDDPDIYISFTQIEKVGINPMSSFNTPLGIYTYPLKASWAGYGIEEYERKERKESLFLKPPVDFFPYAADGKFVHVLRQVPVDGMHFISSIGPSQFTTKDEQKYYRLLLKRIPDVFGIPVLKVHSIIAVDAGANAKFSDIPFGRFWYVTMRLAQIAAEQKKGIGAKSLVQWNHIMRLIGISGVADTTGTGIIHTSEPVQAVFFTREAFREEVAPIPNSTKPRIRRITSFEQLKKILEDSNDLIEDSHIKFSTGKNEVIVPQLRDRTRFLRAILEGVKIERGIFTDSKMFDCELYDIRIGLGNKIIRTKIENSEFSSASVFNSCKIIKGTGSLDSCRFVDTQLEEWGKDQYIKYSDFSGKNTHVVNTRLKQCIIDGGTYKDVVFHDCHVRSGNFDGCHYSIEHNHPKFNDRDSTWKNGTVTILTDYVEFSKVKTHLNPFQAYVIYEQMWYTYNIREEEVIRKAIETGKFPPGGRFNSINDLRL